VGRLSLDVSLTLIELGGRDGRKINFSRLVEAPCQAPAIPSFLSKEGRRRIETRRPFNFKTSSSFLFLTASLADEASAEGLGYYRNLIHRRPAAA
jgi:hypothetical protein